MGNMKISSEPFDRGVNSSQRAEKQRDESFVASALEDNAAEKNKSNSTNGDKAHTSEVQDRGEDRSKLLVDSHRQDIAQQINAKEKMERQLEKVEELSQQRLIEERSSVNKQKLKGSYTAVQQSDNQKQAQETSAEKNKESRPNDDNSQDDAINLVV